MSRVVDSVDGCRQLGYVSVSRVSIVVDSCRHLSMVVEGLSNCRWFVDSLSIVVDAVEGFVEGYVIFDNHRQPSTNHRKLSTLRNQGGHGRQFLCVRSRLDIVIKVVVVLNVKVPKITKAHHDDTRGHPVQANCLLHMP
jgi:hypothetical protein